MSQSKQNQKKNMVTFSIEKSTNKKDHQRSSLRKKIINYSKTINLITANTEKLHHEGEGEVDGDANSQLNSFRTDSVKQIKPKAKTSTSAVNNNNSSSNPKRKTFKTSTTLPSVRDNKIEETAIPKAPDSNRDYDVKPLLPMTLNPGGNSNPSRGNIRVYARVRPLNEVEADLLENKVGILCIENISSNSKGDTMVVKNANGFSSGPYTFDRLFQPETPQESVYNVVGKEIAQDILSGYNGTIFAYGQSGSGKTHTMYGPNIFDDEQNGIIPRLISDLFNYVGTIGESITFQFKMSILQIYKEVIYDLLTGERDLKIKENPIRGIYVEKLTEVYINTIESFMTYVELAINNRIVSETKLNSTSSRSHSILILEVTQTFVNENYTKKGTLNLVDLAGSEKISKTGAVGETLEEAKKINLSLSSLGHVIHSLTSGADHIPYRDSKLTRILQESLGGNFKTSLIVTCSPHSYHFEETVSSFQFAQRAKFIKNKVKINIKLSYEELQKIITQLRKSLSKANSEILRLKGLLPPGTEVNLFSLEEDYNNNNTISLNTNNISNVLNNTSQQQDDLIKDSLNILSMGITAKASPNKEIINNDPLSLKESDPIEDNAQSQLNETKPLAISDNKNRRSSSLPSSSSSVLAASEGHCLKCVKNKEVIKQLQEKIDSLKNKMKEKDDIISTLNNSNDNKLKQINELKLKLTSSPQMISNTIVVDDNSNSNLKTIDDLYKEIQSKLSNIQQKQIEANKTEMNPSKFNQATPQLIKDLLNLYSINLKTAFNDSSNGHILLLNSIAGLLSKSLGVGIGTESLGSDNDFAAITEAFKTKTAEIFDGIFIFTQHEMNTFTDANGSIKKDLKRQMIDFICLYLFGYLQAYASIQAQQQLNHKLLDQNCILKSINLILMTIVEDLLRSNIDIGQKCTLLNKEKIRSSIIGLKNSIFAAENDEYDNIIRQSFIDSNNNNSHTNINSNALSQPFQRQKGRIRTLVNRKGIEALNIIQERYMDSFLKKNELASSFAQVPIVIQPPKTRDIPEKESSKIGLSALFVKKQEKKKSKLTTMKEFIVKAIQQTDNYKSELERIKEHFINLVELTQANVLSKLIETGLIKDSNLLYDFYSDDNKPNQTEKDLSEEANDVRVIVNQSNKRTRNKQILTPISKRKEGGGDDYLSSNPLSERKPYMNHQHQLMQQYPHHHQHAYSKIMTMTCDSEFKAHPFQLEQNQQFVNHTMSYDIGSIKVSQKNIEALIEDYLEIGTATRKFDGISVKYEGSKVKCSYESGLNAQNTITSIPIQKKLISHAGDTSTISSGNDDDDTNANANGMV